MDGPGTPKPIAPLHRLRSCQNLPSQTTNRRQTSGRAGDYLTSKTLLTTSPLTHLDQIKTLGDIARHYARDRPTAIAMTFEGRDTTFAQFDHHSNQVAHALAAEGMTMGE